VAGEQRVVRPDGQVIVAGADRDFAGRDRDRVRQAHHRQHRVEERDVDVLAAAAGGALVQREQDALNRVQTREIVGDGDADARRGAVAKAGHLHDPRLALNHRVVSRQLRVRTGLAVAGNRAVDQARIQRGRGRVIEAELAEAAGTEVLDQHVGGLDQPPQRSRAGRRLEIERHALLVAIELVVERADAVDERSPAARIVAMRRLLDLEHLGAHVAEHHRRERTGDDPGQVDDAYSIEWGHAAFYRLAAYDASRTTSSSATTPTRRCGSARWTTGTRGRARRTRRATSID